MWVNRLLKRGPLLPPRPCNRNGRKTLRLRPVQASVDDLLRGLAKAITVPIEPSGPREPVYASNLDTRKTEVVIFPEDPEGRRRPSARKLAATCALLMVAASSLDGRGIPPPPLHSKLKSPLILYISEVWSRASPCTHEKIL